MTHATRVRHPVMLRYFPRNGGTVRRTPLPRRGQREARAGGSMVTDQTASGLLLQFLDALNGKLPDNIGPPADLAQPAKALAAAK